MKRDIRRFVGVFLACSIATVTGVEILYTTNSSQHLSHNSNFQNSVSPEATLQDPSADAVGEQALEGIAGSDSAQASGRSQYVQAGRSSSRRENAHFGGRAHQRTEYQTLMAFRDSVGEAWKSTVQIIVKSRQVAMGAIVHRDGWIVTKSSEVPDRMDVKLFDGTKAIGAVTARHEDMDIALLKIERNDLVPVVWNINTEIPVGGWLISSDTRQMPLTIGVLSVANRNVRAEKPVLGVRLGIPADGSPGAVVESIVAGGGADRAGMEVGDVIRSVDGVKLGTRDEVLGRLRGLQAGQTLNLGVMRESRELALTAQMMDLTSSLFDSTEMEVNGQISARATGFRNVMQHDTVLLPHQCGGPVLDVEGRAIGLNIARNGRVASLAYHAKSLEPAIRKMLQMSGGPTMSSESSDIVQASATDNAGEVISIPAAVPTSIQVESLRPEIILPAQL